MSERPIASRVVRKCKGGEELHLNFYAPVRQQNGSDWLCRVVLQLSDGTIHYESECNGIDSVQALQTAFSFVRQQIGDDYTWLDMPALLGFPAPIPCTFGVELYRAVEKLTQEATNDFIESRSYRPK